MILISGSYGLFLIASPSETHLTGRNTNKVQTITKVEVGIKTKTFASPYSRSNKEM